MTFKLYLPYYSYDSNFEVDQNYYSSNADYAKAIKDEYNKTNNSVQAYMTSSNSASRVPTAKFTTTQPTNDEHIAYSSCEAVFIGEDGTEETVDTMIGHMAYQDVFIVEMNLNFDTIDEDFEGDLYEWKKAHESITKYGNSSKVSEDWVLKNEPKRDIKISFQNKANETVYMELKNCKIIEQTAINKYYILIEKAIIIDKFL